MLKILDGSPGFNDLTRGKGNGHFIIESGGNDTFLARDEISDGFVKYG
jgi:hypothetical protein